jgi:hypothetical protein
MNINKLLSWLNLVAVLLTLIFCVCLKTLIPAQHKSYIDGFLLIVVPILSAGPFIINYLLLQKIPSEKQKMTYFSLFLFILLMAVNLFCLIFLYGDQFETSRGFALIACVPIYLYVFLPLWLVFLYKIKKCGQGYLK